jgi:AcrR family transcriptional regulator
LENLNGARTEKPDRRADRRARTAQDLVAAAQRVLAAKGYHGAKVADIAREAGVGVGTFYLYYPTKEAVFLELVEEATSQLRQQLTEASSQGNDPADVSRRRIQVFFHFAARNRDLFRIIFGHDASFHDVVRRAQEMFAADIVQNIRGGIEEGIFRQGHPEIWAQALVGMCIQSVSWWVENDHVSAADVAGQIAALAQHGMINVHS